MNKSGSPVRYVVGAMALSAAGLIGLVGQEDFTATAVIPTKNDRPTVGYGSTFWENGKPVKMGDKITPVRALYLAGAHISKEEANFRRSIPAVKLTQGEYDVYMDWVYQYGTGAWSKSSMRSNLIAGNYASACKALKAYKFSGGHDCSIPGNKVCAGVWTRQLKRYDTCMGEQ